MEAHHCILQKHLQLATNILNVTGKRTYRNPVASQFFQKQNPQVDAHFSSQSNVNVGEYFNVLLAKLPHHKILEDKAFSFRETSKVDTKEWKPLPQAIPFLLGHCMLQNIWINAKMKDMHKNNSSRKCKIYPYNAMNCLHSHNVNINTSKIAFEQ